MEKLKREITLFGLINVRKNVHTVVGVYGYQRREIRNNNLLFASIPLLRHFLSFIETLQRQLSSSFEMLGG